MEPSLTQMLHRAVQCRSKAVATIHQGRERTYAQVIDRVARLAGALLAIGVKPGDRVGLLALNSDRSLEYYLGAWWAGAVVNPVNTRWSAGEMAYSLDDCATEVVIVDDQFLSMVDSLRSASRVRTWIYMGEHQAPAGMLDYETLLRDAAAVHDTRRNGADLAGLFYTGGTTGRPKGVMLSHAALTINTQVSLLGTYFNEDALLLHAAPLFHLAGLSILMRGLMMASTQIILPGFTPGGMLDAIEKGRASHLMVVPSMLQMLVDDPRMAHADVSSVRLIGYGASPITPALLERALTVFPNAEFAQGYGMTELSAGVTYLSSRHHTPEGRKLGKLTSAGHAMVGIDIRICDESGREVPKGTVGELAVLSPCVMQGYWNQPELTAKVLRDGWMFTGDAARMDEDGFVYIVDRFKDMIVSGGENVYCAEVEGALASHPAVAQGAVFGVPDGKWGERVHAVVVLKPGAEATDADLIAHCRGHIAGYKCPRSIEFAQSLPISGAGKIMKYKLREPYWAGHERRVA